MHMLYLLFGGKSGANMLIIKTITMLLLLQVILRLSIDLKAR
jgi:hypothetical protein